MIRSVPMDPKDGIILSHSLESSTVKPLLSGHIKQDTFWLFKPLVAYCCMKVVQKAHEC